LSSGQDGENAGLVNLYRQRYVPMVRLATFLTGSREDAEELVQDVFLRLGKRGQSPDDPAAYVRAAVVNACHSRFRRRRVEQRVVSPPYSPVVDHPRELWGLLDRLPGRQRAAIVLRYYCDLPEEEIALALRCRPSTVRSLVRRALTRLRKAMEES
jgi:DNA-directed RNA polymerase specialized sigma24 family protein